MPDPFWLQQYRAAIAEVIAKHSDRPGQLLQALHDAYIFRRQGPRYKAWLAEVAKQLEERERSMDVVRQSAAFDPPSEDA